MEKEIEIRLPKLGESILNATVVTWLKKEGELIELDEPLLEVSTDKVNSEIPSPVAGRLKKIHVAVDQEVEVGALIAVVTSELSPSKGEQALPTEQTVPPEAEGDQSMKGFFTPNVLRFAREKGIGVQELEKIPGTGSCGRLSRKDVEAYLSKRETGLKAEEEPSSSSQEVDKKIPLTSVRRSIAKSMADSSREIPHATLIFEVDMSLQLEQLGKSKEAFMQKNGCKLSVTAVIAKALVDGVKKYPLVNSSFGESAITLKRSVNLGIAVSVDQGVMVPVIRNCQDKGVGAIAKEIAQLAQKTREGRLDPQDVQEGTITLTNFGISQAVAGFPIIRAPEAAIIGAGAIQKRVVVIEEAQKIRSILTLSLTFDHRVFDGMYGCDFLGEVKQNLEKGGSIIF